jgi:hypothetical protein
MKSLRGAPRAAATDRRSVLPWQDGWPVFHDPECPAGHRSGALALLANPDLIHQPDDIVEQVLFDDLSVVPARDRAEVHLE